MNQPNTNTTVTPARLRLRLTPAAERAVKNGHPWVFDGKIAEQNRTGITGELAMIYGAKTDKFLAAGLYDADSPMRVRIIHTGKPVNIDTAWWQQRLEETVAKRASLATSGTDGYRLINGESEGWPGLVLDRYADALVLKLYSAVWLPRLAEIEAMIISTLHPASLHLRLSRNISAAATAMGLAEGVRYGEDRETVVFHENGLAFEAAIRLGQKTGFFLDQRENRQRAGALTKGAHVLNCFSFSGGFSVYAARGGAVSVTDADISAAALDAGDRNWALNPQATSQCRRERRQTDVFTWLAQAPTGRLYDVVITDPPSLAKREAGREAAIIAYTALATDALRHIRPGGILISASCSAHVSSEEFIAAIQKAVRPRFRQILWTTAHAPDHPATFPEAQYLKCIAIQV